MTIEAPDDPATVFVSAHILMQPVMVSQDGDVGDPETIPSGFLFLQFCRWNEVENCPMPCAGTLRTDRDRWDEVGSARFDALLGEAGPGVAVPQGEQDRARRFLATRCPGAPVRFLPAEGD